MLRKELILLLSALCLVSCGERSVEEQEEAPEMSPLGIYLDNYSKDTSAVKSGETFSSLLIRLGVSSSDAYRITQACDTVFDARKIIAGRRVTALRSLDSLHTLDYIVYDNSRTRSTIFQCRDSIAVWRYDRPVVIEEKQCDVTIHSSLWNDMIDAGVSPELIVNLSDIYAWTINFFSLQEGDRFRAFYRQKVCEGEVIGVEDVDFCIFNNSGQEFCAIRFDQGDGRDKFWNEKGESMKKAFLKAPLKYNRISSRFSYARKHPVTGKVRPHTGVDYAAPTGTPVHSIGNGTVTLCGWDSSGGGNRIKIKHMNGYETAYLHLSKFAKGIRVGSKVAQGQTIGFVGSTGRSTGPHLDFRVWKNGTPINPLKMISPPAEPLKKENLDSLNILCQRYKSLLESAPVSEDVIKAGN